MAYQVLARKWRPKTFAQLVGQEHVIKALANAFASARLHHAYLLTGTRGVGAGGIICQFEKNYGESRMKRLYLLAALTLPARRLMRVVLSICWKSMRHPILGSIIFAKYWITRSMHRPPAVLKSTLSTKCTCFPNRHSMRC